MHNGAEVEIEEMTNRHNENFLIMPQGHNESIEPKAQHKQGGSGPNRDSNLNNKLQHSGKSPFVFLILLYTLLNKKSS